MRNWVAVATSAILLMSACAPREEILEGERLSLTGETVVDVANYFVAENLPSLSLPAAADGDSWTHQGGSVGRVTPHRSLASNLTQIWSVPIGQGEGRRHAIVASPVVSQGVIFTLDSRAQVVATNAEGARLWARDLTPSSDRGDDASGGGLAVDDRQVFATTGYGELVAMSAETGAVEWVQDLEAFGGAAPAVFGDLVYVAARDGSAWAIDRDTGRVRWQIPGPDSEAHFVGGIGPAVTSKWAIFPFGTGELVSTFRRGGIQNWTTVLGGRRPGTAIGTVTDLRGGPVIQGDKVFVGNVSGRVASLDLATGERIWTAPHGVSDQLTVAGQSLFMVSDENLLMRLDARSGDVLWSRPLPRYTKDKPNRFKSVFAHYGPILAGNRLIVASDDGMLRMFDPADGSSAGELPINKGAASAPVVAGNTLYVLTTRGMLTAFR